MRTLKKFLAGILVCALAILPLAGCSGAIPDDTSKLEARMEILEAVNDFRAESGLVSVSENVALTNAECLTLEVFREAGAAQVSYSAYKEARDEADRVYFYNELSGAIEYPYSSVAGTFGLSTSEESNTAVLLCKYRKDAVLDQIESNPTLNDQLQYSSPDEGRLQIGIGIVTVGGETYWCVRLYD